MTTTTSTNRVLDAIAAMEERIASIAPGDHATAEQAATMEPGDLMVLGSIPSRGLAAGLLRPDEAQTLHAIHTDFASRSVAARMVFMQICFELMRKGA